MAALTAEKTSQPRSADLLPLSGLSRVGGFLNGEWSRPL